MGRGRVLRYPSRVIARSPPDAAPPDARTPRVVIVMPAYNAARTLERTYADIPHDLVDRIILVDDVSRDETVDIARQLGPRRDHPQPEPRLRRQPEDLLRRGARGRRRHRRHAPPRLPVRRDADPGAHRADRRRRARPDARQPVPGRPAGRRHAALEVRQQPVPDRSSRTSPSGSTCPSTTPGCGPTAGTCSRRSRTSSTATTSCSTRSSSPRSWRPGCAARIGEIAVPTRYFEEASLGRLPAQRRVRPVDAAGRRSLPAPSPPRPALAQARRPPPRRLTAGDADQPTRARCAATLGIAISVVAIWILVRLGRPRRRRSTVLRDRVAGLDRGDARRPASSTSRARGARWRAPARADRAAAVPARARLHATSATSPTTSCRPASASSSAATALGEGEGVSRTTVLGTVVVERVVDTVMVVAHRGGRGPRPERPRGDDQRRPARARVRRAAGHRPRARDRRPSPAGRGPGRRDHRRALAAAARARPPAARGPGRRRPAADARRRRSPSARSPGRASIATFLAAGQAVGVELTVAQAALLTSGVALATIVPSGPGLPRHVRADRGGHRRRLRHPARLGVRAGAAGPRDDPGDDVDRRRHRDGRACRRRRARPTAAERPGRAPSRRPTARSPASTGGEPAPERGVPARVRTAPAAPSDAAQPDHLRGPHRQHGRGRPARRAPHRLLPGAGARRRRDDRRRAGAGPPHRRSSPGATSATTTTRSSRPSGA